MENNISNKGQYDSVILGRVPSSRRQDGEIGRHGVPVPEVPYHESAILSAVQPSLGLFNGKICRFGAYSALQTSINTLKYLI